MTLRASNRTVTIPVVNNSRARPASKVMPLDAVVDQAAAAGVEQEVAVDDVAAQLHLGVDRRPDEVGHRQVAQPRLEAIVAEELGQRAVEVEGDRRDLEAQLEAEIFGEPEAEGAAGDPTTTTSGRRA
jgi:hypothetical protein